VKLSKITDVQPEIKNFEFIPINLEINPEI